MTYRGHIKNGVVVPDEPIDLPDGTEVRIDPLARERSELSKDELRRESAAAARRLLAARGEMQPWDVNIKDLVEEGRDR